MEEKLAINNEYLEKLRKIDELVNEQIKISEKFNEDQDEDAVKGRLQSLIQEHQTVHAEAQRLAGLLVEQTSN